MSCISLFGSKRQIMRNSCLLTIWVCALPLSSSLPVVAQEDTGENPSKLLAKIKNTDLRWQCLDVDPPHINDIFLDGAFMATDRTAAEEDVAQAGCYRPDRMGK